MAGMIRQAVTATISAQNTFSDPLQVGPDERASVSISGTFTATVVLQRRFLGGSWLDVPKADGNVGWTAGTELTYEADETVDLRLGVKTGGYTNGDAVVRLGKG